MTDELKLDSVVQGARKIFIFHITSKSETKRCFLTKTRRLTISCLSLIPAKNMTLQIMKQILL